MSKSIMIVICDFLLLSLISLANFDSPPSGAAAEQLELQAAAEQRNFADSQMLELLKMSLDAERDRRESLDSDVSKLAKAAEENKSLAESRKKSLDERERELAEIAKARDELARAKAELERERAAILKKSGELQSRAESSEKRNEKLKNEIIAAGEKLEKSARERIDLERRLGDVKQSDSAARQKLESVQLELKQSRENLERLAAEGDALKSENRAIEAEKQALATRLEVASAKEQIYRENIKRYETLVNIEKNEKEKIREHAETLAVGVGELAAQQEKMTRSVGELRPKTSSEIFAGIKPRLATATLTYVESGIFGKNQTTVSRRLVPIEMGGKIWLVANSEGTPFAPFLKKDRQYSEPESMSVSVRGKSFEFKPDAVVSLAEDPRLIAIAVPREFLEKEKIEPLKIPKNTFAFPDCVVVDAQNSKYGQVPFRADFKNADYARLDVGLMQSVFGEFSPSAGDIAISRNGDFAGIVLGGDLAVLLRAATPLKSAGVGAAYSKKSARELVENASSRFAKIPYGLR